MGRIKNWRLVNRTSKRTTWRNTIDPGFKIWVERIFKTPPYRWFIQRTWDTPRGRVSTGLGSLVKRAEAEKIAVKWMRDNPNPSGLRRRR